MSENQELESQDQNKIIEYDNVKYLLNEEENTAGVIKYKFDLQQIHIPATIKKGTKEFNVTRIMEESLTSLNTKSIDFASDSKLQTIEKSSFYDARIKMITIPSSVTLIGERAFQHCVQLESIEFPTDSKLQTIGKKAFFKSTIKSIKIPSSVTLIGESAFSKCKQLERVEIPNDSKLQAIEKNAFSWTKIESITIPSEFINLKEGWCNATLNITEIIVSPNNSRYCLYENNLLLGKARIEDDNYDILVFCTRNIKHIKIPNFIKHICSYSFDHCEQLETIEIPNDSKLKTFGKDAFLSTKIENITIPSELINLKEGWCNATPNLTKIIVSPDNPRYCLYEEKLVLGKSKIEENNYDCLVFCNRNIKHIKIPNFIRLVCSYSFNHCNQLKTIEISSESKLEIINKYAFSGTIIKSITIPSSVKLIGEGAFHNCDQLERIEIPNDSKLKKIDKDAFSLSSIKRIRIPSSVTSIEKGAFSNCRELKVFEILNDSKLKKIDEYAFIGVRIKSISIPSSVTFIGDDVFTDCLELQIIECNSAVIEMMWYQFYYAYDTVLIMIPHYS